MTFEELRAFLIEQMKFMKPDLADSTKKDYRRILAAVGTDYVAFLRSAPTSTFVKRKCAILWQLRFLLAETLIEIEAGRGVHDQSWRLHQAMVYADLIRRVASEKRAKSRTQAGKSKKIGLRALSRQGDFRDRLVAAAGKAGRIAILVLAVAGVRPKEIERGVLLTQMDDYSYTIAIGGVKLTDTTGHEHRAQRHDSRLSKLSWELFSALKAVGGKLRLTRTANMLRDDIKAAAVRAKLPRTISPYSLRHQFAADLKATGWSDVDIAKAMGHASTRTGGRYGRKRSGSSGGSSMVKVWASGIVREPKRPLPAAAKSSEHVALGVDLEA